MDIQMDCIEAMAVMPVRSGWMLTWPDEHAYAVRFHRASQSAGLRASRADTRELNVPVSHSRAADRPRNRRTERGGTSRRACTLMGKASQTNAARSD